MNYFDERYGEWGADLELAFQIRHAGKKTLIAGDIRATDHSASDPKRTWNSAQQTLLAADRFTGVAHYLSKRGGFASTIGLRIGAAIGTLLKAITFQASFGLFTGVISGTKVDGTQGEL